MVLGFSDMLFLADASLKDGIQFLVSAEPRILHTQKQASRVFQCFSVRSTVIR